MEPRGGKVPAHTETERAVSQGHVAVRRAADPDNLRGYRGTGVVAIARVPVPRDRVRRVRTARGSGPRDFVLQHKIG